MLEDPEDINEPTISGKIATPPTIGRMPSGTPVCSYTLVTREAWNDKRTGKRCYRDNPFKVEILGEGVHNLADKIIQGNRSIIHGYIRTGDDGQSVRIRVYSQKVYVTARDGYFLALSVMTNAIEDIVSGNESSDEKLKKIREHLKILTE